MTLSTRINAALLRRGHRPALVAGATVLSGHDLRRRALELTCSIRARGVRPGDTVGVVVDRSADSVLAILAVLDLGCAYLPLDPAAPEPWLRQLLRLSQARLIVYPEEGRDAATRLGAISPCGIIPAAAGAYASSSADPLAGGAPPEARLAYVMGTSGTTGPPKAVPVAAASLLHYCDAFAARVGGPATLAGMRMASVTTLAADIGHTMVFPALLFGGELHLVPDDAVRDPRQFATYVQDHQIEALKVVPTHLRTLLDHGPAVLPHRLLVVGGEPFGLDLLERLAECTPRCAVFNHYGPTETTVGVAMRRVDTSTGAANRLRAAGHRTVPVGTALGATDLRVVDERLEPCIPGQTGELVIGGPGVSTGYLGDPHQHEQRFVTTRRSRGEVVFRSGDRARLSPHGEVELFGRTDRQFKVRGHRVEAAGVEEELRAHPAVHDAYVELRTVGELGTALVAWVHADGAPELREYLLARLPSPLVPTRIVVLDELPRTANGKVDPRTLPDPDSNRENSVEEGDAVSRIFAEVLQVPPAVAHGDFFRLGGHSLAALRVIGRLRDECGLEITVADFFANPHPAGVIRAARPVPPDSAPSEPAAPVSPQARALWTHLQLYPRDTAYEIPLRLRIAGPLDKNQIRGALTQVAFRHDALRTRFTTRDGAPMPVIDRTPESTFQFGKPGPLDIETGPLMRATTTKVGPEEHLLGITVHHLVFDGISLSVLIKELTGLLTGEPLPPPATRPAQAWVAAGRLPDPLGDGARARLGLAAEWPAGDAPAHCQERELPADLWPLVESRAAELHTTPFALVAAAWALVLSRQDDEPAVTIGTPVDLRDNLTLAPAVGYLVNVVVLEAEVRPDDAVRDLVARTHRAVGRALACRDRPYADLVAAQRAATGTPPTRTLLTIERLERAAGANVEIRQEAVAAPRPMLGVDVCIVVADGGSAAIQLHHRADVCPEWRGRCLADQLGHVLTRLVAKPDTPVSRVDVLPASWDHRVAEWSHGPAVIPLERWGALGFIDQAATEPDAVALVWPGGTWTRAQLARAVSDTVRTLLDRGLGPGHAVAVSVPPSPAAVVAWHAAQQVGAAVLALDPDWPQRRQADAVGHAQAAVKLSSPDGVRLDADGHAPAAAPHAVDLAYLVLTSGSTGEPKLVAVRRTALANELSWFAAEFPLFAGDRVLAHTSPGFDVAVWEMLGPLAHGATLMFPTVGRRTDVPHLAAVIREHAVTVVQTVPSLLDALLTEADESGPRLVLCGGEELPPSLAAMVAERWPDTTLVNVYGPSETAIDATFHRVDRLGAPGERVPLGKPIAGVRAYVLDDHLRPLPPGAFGQLAIGGTAVGLGYLNDPVETALRFVPDPFGTEPGARLYLTGDRARWDGDGRLEFGGRRDDQVKVRGNRVELGEVEAALRALPIVADAVVHPLAAGTREARLVALVVPAGSTTIPELHRQLAQRLPQYLVPSAFALVESLPRLANGKVARDALRLDALRTPTTGGEWGTAMEERVSRVWAELLGHHRLERDLPFFASGGTSLLIPALRLRLSEEVGVTLSVPELFEHVTIRAQATALEQRAAGDPLPASAGAGRGALRRRALAARRQRTGE